jgi:hypothetical protein
MTAVWRGVAVTGLLVGLAAASVATLGPRWLRSYVVQRASGRGLSVAIERVRLGWLGATFEGVAVELEGVDGCAVRFPSVEVTVDRSLRPVAVTASGGRLTVTHGETLAPDLASWRQRHGGSSGAQGGPALPDIVIHVDEAELLFAGRELKATSLLVHRGQDAVTAVTLGALETKLGGLSVHATDAGVSLDGHVLREVRAATADVAWTDDEAKPEIAQPLPVVAPPPPVVDPVTAKPKKQRKRAPADPPLPMPRLLPDLHELRATLQATIAAAAAKVPDGSKLKIDSLSLRLEKGTEQLTLGSGAFELARDAHGMTLEFSTSAAGRGTPLSLRAILPTEPADIEISVSGGPVPLKLLGMKEGGLLHLQDVERSSLAGRGRIVLDAAGQNLTFDVEGAVRDVSFQEPRLAREPLRGMDLGFATRGLMNDKGELRLDAAEGSLGAAHATVHGDLTQTPEYLAASFQFDFPTSSCQALLASIPSALIPTLNGARMDGTFSLGGHLAVDSRNLDAMAFDYDVNDRCRLLDVPDELDRARFSHAFTHVIYSKKGDRIEETTGPGTERWTALDEISPYMQVAVLTTEDGAFFHHHGFNHTAIRRAVEANVRAHRFVRGASTITMQLAKNLFLSREKTLARKLEELILADYLEQAFTKDEMMELYLNIIEFGPDIYGVTSAAEHYFGRKPNELNLAECMFLSSILPNPIAFHKVYDDGQLGDGWMRIIRARMAIAHQTGLISAAELTEGLAEPVVFHRADAPLPPPRPPVATPSHPNGSSSDWDELN